MTMELNDFMKGILAEVQNLQATGTYNAFEIHTNYKGNVSVSVWKTQRSHLHTYSFYIFYDNEVNLKELKALKKYLK